MLFYVTNVLSKSSFADSFPHTEMHFELIWQILLAGTSLLEDIWFGKQKISDSTCPLFYLLLFHGRRFHKSGGIGKIRTKKAREECGQEQRSRGCDSIRKAKQKRARRIQAQVKYGVRSPKFIWALCHVMCTAVLLGWDPATPPLPHAFGLINEGL